MASLEVKRGTASPRLTRRTALLCAALLVLHAALILHALHQHSVTIDEGGHVLAGVYYWRHQAFHYYHVNPPLIKLLIALPVLASEPQGVDSPPLPDPDWFDRHRNFVRANAAQYMSFIFRARLVLIPLSVFGAWLVFNWARGLFGSAAGFVALTLWSLCPTILAFAGVATVDLGAAVFGLGAMFLFRKYLLHPGRSNATIAGVALGFAELTKFTFLVLYPIWLLLWALGPLREFIRSLGRPGDAAGERRRKTGVLLDPLLGLVVSLIVINAGYAFQHVFRPLGQFSFKSDMLTARTSRSSQLTGNRFHGTRMERLPVPLPAEYLQGLDEQKSHADRGFVNYLCGEWKHGGWWYYYLLGAAIKIALGTWLLALAALSIACVAPRFRASFLEEMLLWIPALVLFLLISSQTGINGHFRYVLPALPFAFIGISRVGRLCDGGWRSARMHLANRVGIIALTGALTWNAFSVLRVHPHYLSYFNETIGGPNQGWKYLADSNIDWGQDLLFLKQWVDEHPEATPLGLAYFGSIDPRLVGLEYTTAPQGPGKQPRTSTPTLLSQLAPRPGWYAVSANFVSGMAFGVYEKGQWIHVPAGVYRYFQHFTPVAKAGYSIFIYHITVEEANRVRKELGLPPLEGEGTPSDMRSQPKQKC